MARSTGFNHFPAISSEILNQLEQAIAKATLDIEAQVKDGWSSSSPSRAGDPPGIDTGTLANSIESDINRSELTGEVGTALEYGPHLEFGTTRMPARPWLRPAVAKVAPSFEAYLRSIEDHLR